MIKFKSISVLILFAAAVLTNTAMAQVKTYKIGDKHPDGGIVVTVDQSGSQGIVVDEKDSGPYTPPEAIAAAKEQGWSVPYLKDLRLIYENLHKQGKGNFQQALYQSVDASSAHYRKGIHFNDGREETGIAQNNKTLVRFIKSFKPSLKEKVVASKATWEGSWSWAADDNFPKDHSKLTVNSETEFVYRYENQIHTLKGKIGYAGDNPKAPLIVDLDLPDGNHLRFEWKSENEVEGSFWQRGQKNNAPQTTAKMTRATSI